MERRLLPLLFSGLFAFHALAAMEIEPRVLGPTAGNVSDIATAHVGEKYLTVWRQLRMPYVGIWGAFADAEGKPLGPAFPILGNANALSLRLFPDGGSFLLIWNEANQSTRMCHVDQNGQATTPMLLDPNRILQPDAFVDGRIVAVSASGATIFDREGATVRSDIAPANPWSLETAFAGNGSFFLVGRWPDLTLSHYSIDGDLLQAVTITKGQCSTTTTPCWWIVGLEELGSGRVLLLLQSQSQQLATMIISEGTPSEMMPMATSFPEVRSASLQRRGSEIWAVVVGGQSAEGPYDVEARVVDGSGIAAGDSIVLMRGVAVYGRAAFAEGPESILVVAVAGDFPSQVQTSLFRGQRAEDPRIVSITPSIQENVQVASNGSGFLAAWSDADGIGFNEVHWAVLDANGQRLSEVFTGGGTMLRHALISNGLEYLMLVSYGGPLVARRIAVDGTLLGETALLEAAADWSGGAAAAPTAAGYLVVWSSGEVVRSLVVTASGVASTPQELFRIQDVPEGWVGWYDDPALANDGDEVLLVIKRVEEPVFYFPPIPLDPVVRLDALRLRDDGYPLSTDPMRLSSDGVANDPPVVASGDQEFLVAWDDQRFAIAPTGVVAVYQAHTGTAATDLIWDGQVYVLAGAGNRFEYLARGGSTLESRSRHGVEGIDVAVDSVGHLLLVGSESGGVGPLRASSYVPSDFVPLPPRRRAVSSR